MRLVPGLRQRAPFKSRRGSFQSRAPRESAGCSAAATTLAPPCSSGTVLWHDRRRITDAVRTEPRVMHVPSLWPYVQPRRGDEAK